MVKISVIIPTYNRASSIVRSVNSVLEQSYKNYEIIVVDDGSTDLTKELLSDLPIKYIYQENTGVSAARNKGIMRASGEWVAFLDSDDEWLPDKLQKQVDYISQNPDINLVHSDEIWIRNGVRVNAHKKHKKGGGDQFYASLKLCAISPSASIVKKDILVELGLFREDFPACEDYDLWLKITSLYEIGYIDEFLIKKYGGHEDQLSQKYIAMDYWRIKSLVWIRENRRLTNDRLEALDKVLIKKCKILLNGYKKHNNMKHFDEIEGFLKKVQ